MEQDWATRNLPSRARQKAPKARRARDSTKMTLEGVWRAYVAAQGAAEVKRINNHLAHGGQVMVCLIFS